MSVITTGLMRLGRDAELRYTPDGTPVAQLSLAYNFGKKDDSGKRPTTWIDAALWGDRAASLSDYLLKGTALIVVLADLHVQEFQRRDQTTGWKVCAKVIDVEFAPSGNGDSRTPAPPPPARAPAPAQRTHGEQRAARTEGVSRPAPAPRPSSGFDDTDLGDIPF